jgi:hypothetical protein
MNKNTNFQKLNIVNIAEMREEVLNYFKIHSDEVIPDKLNGEWTVRPSIDNFPKIREFVCTRSKVPINDTNISFLSPGSSLDIHIDGLRGSNNKSVIANQFVMVVPIANYEDTINYWYTNDNISDENEIINEYEFVVNSTPYKFKRSSVNPNFKIVPSVSTCIDTVAFIRTNVYHSVVNNGKLPRLAVRIRFKEDRWYNDLDHIFEYKDLL